MIINIKCNKMHTRKQASHNLNGTHVAYTYTHEQVDVSSKTRHYMHCMYVYIYSASCSISYIEYKNS